MKEDLYTPKEEYWIITYQKESKKLTGWHVTTATRIIDCSWTDYIRRHSIKTILFLKEISREERERVWFYA